MNNKSINIIKIKQIFFVCILLFLPFILLAQEDFSNDKNIPERPSPPKLVNDFAKLFNEFDAYKLEDKLVAYNDSTSTQIAVVTVETLNGYAEDDFALRLGRKWGIGQKGRNNGILVLIAKEERAVSIELGYGVESFITDTDAKRLIDNVMIPYFKSGDFYGGVDAATNDIIAMLQGTYQNDIVNAGDDNFTKYLIIGFIIFLVLLFLISASTKGGGNGGSYTGGSGGWTWTSGGGSSWSGGSSWGGGSSSGGFGGFGGGSFGGGGASGRW